VTLCGKAGTGKTLLAIAAGHHQVMDTKRYKRLLVSRPIFPMGKDLGYLPGSVEEKLDPWMQPIHDALSLIVHSRNGSTNAQNKKGGDVIASNPLIDVEPLTYIRGRSIPNQFMIVDEAQNLTPLEVKTVITRVGQDTKIILTGDLYQIDNPYVDSLSNGLSAVVEKFSGEELSAHMLFTEGVRSDLAEKAANLL
jgi:PhoH-like ATPase